MKKKYAYSLSALFFALFGLFTYLVKTVDIGALPDVPEKEIGFSKLNNGFHKLTGVNLTWYDITDIMGIAAIGFGLIFAFYGLLKLIKFKSFAKVGRDIYALGGTYILLGVVYAFFEKVIINYRPVIMDGESSPEASYPSSHTVLIVVIMITAIIEIHRLLGDKKQVKTVLTVFGLIYAAIAVVGRLLSGIHWLTDITASLILSTAIIFLFCGASVPFEGKHTKE